MTPSENPQDRGPGDAVPGEQGSQQARQRTEHALYEAQSALRESNERLQLALAAGHLGDWTWDAVSDVVSLSERAAHIFGFPCERLITWASLRGVLHEDDRERARAAVDRALLDRTDHNIEFRVRISPSEVRWVEAYGRSRYTSDGAPVGMTGIVQDITARKNAEDALRDETRILELLNDTGAHLSQKLELVELVQAATDAATEMSGARFGAFFYNVSTDAGESYMLYTLSGAPRASFDKLGHPRATPIFEPTFRGEGPIRLGDVLTDPHYGQWAPHFGMPQGHLPVRSYLAVPVVSRSGEVIGGLFFAHPEPDVFTERAERLVMGVAAQAAIAIDNARLYEAAQRSSEDRKRLLEAERVARAAAERMSEMKDQFLATLSHELRTPLAAILGWAQVLRRSGAKTEADLARGLEAIERNARMQKELIEDLLDMSRIASGKVRLDLTTVDPATFIDSAIDTVRPSADAAGIVIESSMDDHARNVTGDAARLQQVVWNLLSNAIKFTSRGGRVAIRVRNEGVYVEIRVSDTGIGIRPEFLAHLFERFRQADASTTRKYGGLGLGLSIVKNLVELHGGSVHAESEGEGRGATFSVLLPAAPSPHGDARMLAERIPPLLESLGLDSLDLSGVRVLIVDDDTDSRELIGHVLSDCAASVIAAGSAVEALELVQQLRPHVMVSDIGMPEVDGIDLLRRIRALGHERGGNTPAIALTAFARSEDRRRVLSAGYSEHLAKPVEAAKLVAAVAAAASRTES